MKRLKALREAGSIASQARKRVQGEVKPGAKVIDICESVENQLSELGGKPAFPCNVDINQVAAHYASPLGDETVIPDDSIVKVDLGVHIEGYIADTATTICLDPSLEPLFEAAKAALNAAIKTVMAGVRASEVGSVIERAMRLKGFKPIRNLTGHKMTRYVLHAGKTIPNVSDMNGHRLKAGDVYAIEPFAVPMSAVGEVRNGPPSNIYCFVKKRSVGGQAKRMLKYIQGEYRTLPFASRWVLRRFRGPEGQNAFQELIDAKCITSYPQLIERSGAMVAQAEHTVIVTEDGCEVTTA